MNDVTKMKERNKGIMLNDEAVKAIAELRVRGIPISFKEEKCESHTIVFTQTCEEIDKHYGSLEAFWNRVKNNTTLKRFGFMYSLAIHQDGVVPHIHLTIHSDERLDKFMLAFELGVVEFGENDSIMDTHEELFTCYSNTLDDTYKMYLKDKFSGVSYGTLVCYITPQFIEYIDRLAHE